TPGFFSALQIAKQIGLAATIAIMAAIALHPFKRGWHELWARSYVTRNPTPTSFYQRLASDPELPIQRMIALNFKLTFVVFLVGAVAIVETSYRMWMGQTTQ